MGGDQRYCINLFVPAIAETGSIGARRAFDENALPGKRDWARFSIRWYQLLQSLSRMVALGDGIYRPSKSTQRPASPAVLSQGNVYTGRATASTKDQQALEVPTCQAEPSLHFDASNQRLQLTIQLTTDVIEQMPHAPIVTSDMLGEAFQPEQVFTEPDGRHLVLDQDLLGQNRTDQHNQSGPFNNLKPGTNVITVWQMSQG